MIIGLMIGAYLLGKNEGDGGGEANGALDKEQEETRTLFQELQNLHNNNNGNLNGRDNDPTGKNNNDNNDNNDGGDTQQDNNYGSEG